VREQHLEQDDDRTQQGEHQAPREGAPGCTAPTEALEEKADECKPAHDPDGGGRLRELRRHEVERRNKEDHRGHEPGYENRQGIENLVYQVWPVLTTRTPELLADVVRQNVRPTSGEGRHGERENVATDVCRELRARPFGREPLAGRPIVRPGLRGAGAATSLSADIAGSLQRVVGDGAIADDGADPGGDLDVCGVYLVSLERGVVAVF